MSYKNSDSLQIIIDAPASFSTTIYEQVISLIETGGQIRKEYIRIGMHRALLLGVILDGDLVVCTCTLKNPQISYRTNVFKLAGIEANAIYKEELGYITTHRNYEGQKLCQKLINEMWPILKTKLLFATTRKDAMRHVLAKYGFQAAGRVYKKDLQLMVFKER